MTRPKIKDYGDISGSGAYDYVSDVNKYIDNLEGLLAVAKCPNSNCDNRGTLATQSYYDGTFEPEPCQWCNNKKAIL